MPVATLGGAIPAIVGVACASAILLVTERPTLHVAIKVIAASTLLAACWGFFFALRSTAKSVTESCRFDPARVYVQTSAGMFDVLDPGKRRGLTPTSSQFADLPSSCSTASDSCWSVVTPD